MTVQIKSNLPLIKCYEDSQFKTTWKRKCQNMNHDEFDNPRTDTFLVLVME